MNGYFMDLLYYYIFNVGVFANLQSIYKVRELGRSGIADDLRTWIDSADDNEYVIYIMQ